MSLCGGSKGSLSAVLRSVSNLSCDRSVLSRFSLTKAAAPGPPCPAGRQQICQTGRHLQPHDEVCCSHFMSLETRLRAGKCTSSGHDWRL